MVSSAPFRLCFGLDPERNVLVVHLRLLLVLKLLGQTHLVCCECRSMGRIVVIRTHLTVVIALIQSHRHLCSM